LFKFRGINGIGALHRPHVNFDVGHTAADQAEIGAGCPDIEMVLEPCHRMSVGVIAIAKTVFANFSEVGDAKTRIRLWIKTPHE
jgi:hypothetical protein